MATINIRYEPNVGFVCSDGKVKQWACEKLNWKKYNNVGKYE